MVATFVINILLTILTKEEIGQSLKRQAITFRMTNSLSACSGNVG